MFERQRMSRTAVALMPLCGFTAAGGAGAQQSEYDAADRASAVLQALEGLPRGYVCLRTASPPTIDGRLDDVIWERAPWSEEFVDIEGDRRPVPNLRTRFRMLWDDTYLYVGVELQEPHVRARVRTRDEPIHQLDSNIELFLDPDGDTMKYAELQMNAIGTIFDLLLERPYRDGAFALFNWDAHGLRTAVHVDGTVNDPSDVDRGWSVEVAIPWLGTMSDFAHRRVPPVDGDRWRINLSRVQWPDRLGDGGYVRGADARENNWVWSPQGVIAMHRPETWGLVEFRDALEAGPGTPVDPAQAARAMLYLVHDAQVAFRLRHARWARSFDELELPAEDVYRLGDRVAGLADGIAVPVAGSLRLTSTESLYEIAIDVRGGELIERWHVGADSRLWSSRSGS